MKIQKFYEFNISTFENKIMPLIDDFDSLIISTHDKSEILDFNTKCGTIFSNFVLVEVEYIHEDEVKPIQGVIEFISNKYTVCLDTHFPYEIEEELDIILTDPKGFYTKGNEITQRLLIFEKNEYSDCKEFFELLNLPNEITLGETSLSFPSRLIENEVELEYYEEYLESDKIVLGYYFFVGWDTEYDSNIFSYIINNLF